MVARLIKKWSENPPSGNEMDDPVDAALHD